MTSVPLSFPEEAGVKHDFLACAIRNDYGLGQRLKCPRTILDVGANVGFFSLCARSFYPTAKIHAYEPNPRIFPFLEQNVSKCDVTLFQEALGAKSGRNLATTQSVPDGPISQTSLASVLSRIGGHVDLLKLDCEGAEWDLFEASECWDAVGALRMEYHLLGSHTIKELQVRLSELRFGITRCIPEGSNFGLLWAEH